MLRTSPRELRTDRHDVVELVGTSESISLKTLMFWHGGCRAQGTRRTSECFSLLMRPRLGPAAAELLRKSSPWAAVCCCGDRSHSSFVRPLKGCKRSHPRLALVLGARALLDEVGSSSPDPCRSQGLRVSAGGTRDAD